MQDRRLVAGGAAIVLVALAVIGLVVMAPRWSVAGLDALAQQKLGRTVSVRGGVHLDVSPLSIRLDDAVLSGPQADDDSFVTAKSAVIPVTLGELLTGRADPSSLDLSEAEIALLIDERGRANWDFPGFTLGQPMRVTLDQASFRYFDERNSQSMALAHVDGVLDLRTDGGAAFSGTAVINDRLVKIDADLKSLARVNADGSPLELALSANEGAGNFSGRLSTAKVLSLAGPVSLASDTPAAALRLIGLPVPPAATVAGPLAIDGALDSAGRAYSIRNATLALGAFRAVGDIAADLRAEVPKLQASLNADTLWLDGLVPASGAADGNWGRVPLPFAVLRGIDAELRIQSRSIAYGNATAGASDVNATLKDGKLDATIAAQPEGNGTLNVTLGVDSTSAPPSVSLNIQSVNAAVQPLLGVLTGVRGLTGTGDLTADLSASGTTQEELAGTLKGTASIGVANGRIAGIDLAALFQAVRQKILDGWPAAAEGMTFDNLNGDATIADGIVTFRELSLEAPSLSVRLEGIVDVLRQGLNVSASAAVNGQPLLAVPVVARGLWGSPKIFPDVPNILANPEGGFARLQDMSPLQGN